MIDLHSHVIPAFDDGASDLAESRSALEAFLEQGVNTLITTPHFVASVSSRPAEMEEYFVRFEAGWAQLVELAGEFPGLNLNRGTEVMLDAPAPDFSDPRVRLAGTSFVLVEFPFMSVPPGIPAALFQLKNSGWRIVIAHPERYANMSDVAAVAEWRGVGAFTQVNAGSFLGRYGPQAKKLAWDMLRNGWIDYVASDYHARGPLRLTETREAIEKAGGMVQARILMEENPSRLLSGDDPQPVPAMEDRTPGWRRFFGGR